MTTTTGTLCEAAAGLIQRGWPIVVCDGKKPLGKGWHKQKLTEADVLRLLSLAIEPAIGCKLGPDSFIDIEADGADEESLFAKLLDGCDPPLTPTYRSRRGKHRLFKFDERLRGTRRAVINYSNGNGVKLGIRIGADGKGAQSVIPPSPGREWIVSLDDCEPAALPDIVVQRILEAAKPRKASVQNGHANKDFDRCRAAMLRVEVPSNENDSSGRLLAVCRQAKRYGVVGPEGVNLVRLYAVRHPFNKDWSDDEILRRIDEANVEVGEALAVRPSSRHLTDLGNAERFAEQHGADVRYCHAWRKWLVWDGRRWAIDSSGEVMRRAKRTARSIYREAESAGDKQDADKNGRWATASEKRERLTAMLALAESEQPIPVAVDSLNAHPRLLNCENGTIELRIGALREHRREDYLTKLCPLEYPTKPDCEPKLWLTFLDRVFAGNAGLIGFLQRLVGMALVGEVLEHILPIFHGIGANGKSVFVETVCGMLGQDYAMSASTTLLMVDRSGRHPTERADLHGKRLVAANESGDGGRLSEETVKLLTSRERVRARRMREDNWEFTPSHTIFLATNHKPEVRGSDYGIWRRIHLIPFAVVIPPAEQDRELANKLRAEWPLILQWAVAGCLAWNRDGLQAPPVVVKATDGYRAEQDLLGEWLAEKCVTGAGCKAGATELYRSFRNWAEDRGERPFTQTRFGTQLTERGYTKGRTTIGHTEYGGVGLRPTGGLKDDV